jgi:hypothetical protein
MLVTILILVLTLILAMLVIGALPDWNYSRAWGYWPSGAFGGMLMVLLLLVATGRA